MSASHAVGFETTSGTAPQTQRTVFTEEENAALSASSAKYSAGLNGSGPVNKFHHAKGRDLVWTKAGLRDFFRYADPGIRKATGNRLDVHLVGANDAPEYGTGWHRHTLGFHAIYMVSGWARFMYEGKPTLVETSDSSTCHRASPITSTTTARTCASSR